QELDEVVDEQSEEAVEVSPDEQRIRGGAHPREITDPAKGNPRGTFSPPSPDGGPSRERRR
ncbi:MAG TPA: hypothetical protein VM165_03825, partial [Planctomycetaceae bacterium]|nr:hypothetical protein [Planctomycetaceae bacterium]